MLALGGSIGTGLFVASGAAISQAGPGGALAAYLVIGVMVLLSDDGVGRTCRLFPGKRHLCRLRRTVCGSGLRVRPGRQLRLQLGWYWSALFLALLFFHQLRKRDAEFHQLDLEKSYASNIAA